MASCEAIPRLERPLPVGNGAELIKRRPDIRQAERQLAASTSQIGIETAALYPTVKLGAGLGVTSRRSEEHTSELQSLIRSSYAIFSLKKNKMIRTSTMTPISAVNNLTHT